jgi:DNA-binding GntR family transcriptional regulator
MKDMQSAQAQAYMLIRDRIRSGRLAGGSRVVAEDISLELSVSRMPVREAIRQLDSEGLLMIRPNRGAVVVELGVEELGELFEMRAVLEGLAARRALPQLDEDAEDRLFLALRRLKRAASSVDVFIEQHNALHALICGLGSIGGDRGRLAAETERLRTAVEPYLRLYFTDHGGADTTSAEHGELVEVLLSRDPDAVETAMRRHILSTATDLAMVLHRPDRTPEFDTEVPI